MKYFSVLVFFILICTLLCGCTKFADDGLHPNTKGYKIIANLVAEMLTEKLCLKN